MLLPARQHRQGLTALLVLFLIYLYWPCREATPPGELASDKFVPANDTLGFRRILVINRPARTDRRAAMETVAALSGLALTFVDGITADSGGQRPHDGARGSWLAHLAALDRAAAADADGHALVLEDDVDWDVRIRTQMAWVWAVGTEAAAAADVDIVWLGHCGADVSTAAGDVVAVRPGDPTVPAARHMRPHPLAGPDAWPARFAPRARLVHAVGGDARCSLAYGVSPTGARKLRRLGGRGGDDDDDVESRQWDGALAAWCARGRVRCYAVNPPLFAHWLPPAAGPEGGGGGSDIAGVGGGFVRTAGSGSSAYIRWSVRLNAGVLGALEREPRRLGWEERGEGLKDQWPD